LKEGKRELPEGSVVAVCGITYSKSAKEVNSILKLKMSKAIQNFNSESESLINDDKWQCTTKQ
jgi:hypothetical protein